MALGGSFLSELTVSVRISWIAPDRRYLLPFYPALSNSLHYLGLRYSFSPRPNDDEAKLLESAGECSDFPP